MFEAGIASGGGRGAVLLEPWLHAVPDREPPEWLDDISAAWDDPDLDAWIDGLAAADPDRPLAPAEVLAEVRVDGASLDRLGALDLSGLDADQLVAVAVAADRIANSAHALRARAVAAVPAAMEGGLLGHDWVDARRLAAAEVGAGLALGSGGADLLVDVASILTDRLPDTLAAASRGELSWPKVVALAEATAPLTDELAAAVEARVLPGAAGRTPAQHRAMIRRWVDRVDPEGAEGRRRRATADIELSAPSTVVGSRPCSRSFRRSRPTWSGPRPTPTRDGPRPEATRARSPRCEWRRSSTGRPGSCPDDPSTTQRSRRRARRRRTRRPGTAVRPG